MDKNASIFDRSRTMIDNTLAEGSSEVFTDKEQNEETLAKIEAQGKNNFKKTNFIQRKDTSKNLQFIKQKSAINFKETQQSDEELAVLYYIANLLLLNHNEMVKLLCEQSFIAMNKASSMFKANIRKYLAYALLNSA